MPYRKDPLVENKIYHILSRSISKYIIFRNNNEFSRFANVLYFYQFYKIPIRFSWYLDYLAKSRKKINFNYKFKSKDKLVDIISYCIMPTHFHLILKQLKPNGISSYIAKVLNSYTRYFNIKTKRKGPLWEGRFKNILIKNNEQLMHLTRYIHLNPVTAFLVKKPEEWIYSSYKEYLNIDTEKKKISKFKNILDIETKSYKDFVNNQIDYQRKLAIIKKLLFNDFS